MRGCLFQPLDDTDFAVGAVVERTERGLIGRAVMRGDGLFDAGKFRDDEALFQPRLEGGDRRAGQPGVGGTGMESGRYDCAIPAARGCRQPGLARRRSAPVEIDGRISG